MRRLTVLPALLLAAAACTAKTTSPAIAPATAPVTPPATVKTSTTARGGVGSTTTASASAAAPPAAPGSTGSLCRARTVIGGVLPDPACTPGATNPAVTQANIAATVCRNGFTASIRPPAAYTDALKRQQIIAYGYADQRPGSYEEDHLIPLELGGAPSDQRNLWPEPGAAPNRKDQIESDLRAKVCAGTTPLALAQQRIATDWTAALAGP